MNAPTLLALLAGATIGAVGALLTMSLLARRVPDRLVRTNINETPVPAVLGIAIIPAGLLCLGLILLVDLREVCCRRAGVVWASAAIALVLAAAGLWDDFRGRELPRGFSGHLAAARSGRLTGGLVKLLAGGAVGVTAGALVGSGWIVLETALLVALCANLVNLLDRAPGRAGKAVLVLGVPLIALGDPEWAVSVVGWLGGLAAMLSLDLRERAMLGDAGANPLGGLIGLGLALALPPPARWACIVVLLALNVGSERYSFSEVIAGNVLLRRLDMLGRKQQV